MEKTSYDLWYLWACDADIDSRIPMTENQESV